MHELSIAISIIDLATEEARSQGWTRVNALHPKLGPLCGVVKDALLFSYDIACRGTSLEGSKLLIEDVPVVIYCEHCCCNRTIQATPNMTCPVCGKLDSQIVSGRELEVVGIEIDDCSQAVAEPAELVQ